MASTGPMNGTAVVLLDGSTVISEGTSCGFNLARSPIDVSSKSSGGWKESIYGQGSGSFDYEGVFTEDATYNFDDLYTKLVAKTLITAKWGSEVAGDKNYSASCVLTSLSMSAPMEDKVTFSATFEFTGAPTQGTNP
jgi:predicted secreted protein